MGRKMQDLTGMKMHRLTFIERVGKTKNGNAIWKARCECGTVFNVEAANVKKGVTRSCGCLRAERNRQRLKRGYSYVCWHCGNDVSWSGDFMESEVNGEGEYPSNDRVVGFYHCSHCGSDFEFYQGRKEEEE